MFHTSQGLREALEGVGNKCKWTGLINAHIYYTVLKVIDIVIERKVMFKKGKESEQQKQSKIWTMGLGSFQIDRKEIGFCSMK